MRLRSTRQAGSKGDNKSKGPLIRRILSNWAKPRRTEVPDNATQVPSKADDQTCDVVIGFDFGTSCTKIIVRSPYHYGGRAYAVPFAEAAHDSSPHLLPSVLRLNSAGELALGTGGGGRLYRDIKVHLVGGEAVRPLDDQDCGIAADILAVAFLALSLRRTRDWFLREQSKLYGGLRLVWHLNVGLPSADYADKELTAVYRAISKAAWLLSIDSSPVGVRTTEAMLNQVRGGDTSGAEDVVEVIPEVAAEVVGYARSQRRSEGLHLLIDVGASTLDICTFILHEVGGDDCYRMLTADVQRLGTMALYRGRVDGMHEAVRAHIKDLWSKCDPIRPIPESPQEYVPEAQTLTEHVLAAGQKYVKTCKRTFWRAIIDLKTRRDPYSPRWKDGLPTFLCGGGSAMQLYRDMLFSELTSELAGFYRGARGLLQYSLPKPAELEATIDEANYHRLAVAWGLSYPDYDIGTITRPCEIDDVPRPKEIEKPEISWER